MKKHPYTKFSTINHILHQDNIFSKFYDCALLTITQEIIDHIKNTKKLKPLENRVFDYFWINRKRFNIPKDYFTYSMFYLAYEIVFWAYKNPLNYYWYTFKNQEVL